MKKSIRTNFRVIIEPKTDNYFGEPLNESGILGNCRELERLIEKHLDRSDYKSLDVVYDDVEVCEFCKCDTNEIKNEEEAKKYGDPIGWPYCCDEAQEEFYKLHPEIKRD